MPPPPQADRQYDIPPQHRLPKQPKDSFLVAQVFSPRPHPASLKAHLKSNPLYTDMRLTELAEVKRGQPSWTIEEYTRNAGDKGKLTALDLQVSLARSPSGGAGGGGAAGEEPGPAPAGAGRTRDGRGQPAPAPFSSPGRRHGIRSFTWPQSGDGTEGAVVRRLRL